ncbi:MAG: hypothetical protein ACHQF3_00105 [Alphaproteobacteria bacterium]
MRRLDFAQYARELERQLAELRPAVTVALAKVGAEAATIARKKIGREDNADVGPFMEWEPLADSTIAEKERLGYFGQVSETDPLLREGTLRDSIRFGVEGLQLLLYSTSKIAGYHEYGTSKMPPRPFLGPSLLEVEPAAQREIGGAAARVLAGGRAEAAPAPEMLEAAE